MKIKNFLIVLGILSVFTAGFWLRGKFIPPNGQSDTIYVSIPAIPGKTDTIYLDSIVYKKINNKIVDSTFYHKYIEAKEEVDKLALFLEAIKIQDTTVLLADNDTISLNVTSRTRGKLIFQYADYIIKERVIDVPIIKEEPTFLRVNGGLFVNLPTEPFNYNFGVGPKIDLIIKEKDIYSVGWDPFNKVVTVGATKTLLKL